MKYKLFFTLLIFHVTLFAQKEKKPTLYELKKFYIGKEVIVKSILTENKKQYDWEIAKKKGEYYVTEGASSYLPIKYLYQKAKIIAIQLASIKREEIVGKKDVFGDPIIIDSIVNPYFEMVVEFKDGTKALINAYALTLDDRIELLDHYKERKTFLENLIPEITGDTLYATALSKLYKSTISIDEMLSITAQGKFLRFPKLEPMIIEKAKYISPQNMLVIKLKTPNNQSYISYFNGESYIPSLKTAIEIVANGLNMEVEIPSWLTQDEINAIKEGIFFNGMNINALYRSIGFPDEENTNSYGGNQLIYNDRFFIYLDDNNEKVESWQFIDY